jgi:4-hydroxybenzoate polyprenyltransferase
MMGRGRGMTAIQVINDWKGEEDNSLNRKTNKNTSTKMNRKQMLALMSLLVVLLASMAWVLAL